jgi:hypothetical protein
VRLIREISLFLLIVGSLSGCGRQIEARPLEVSNAEEGSPKDAPVRIAADKEKPQADSDGPAQVPAPPADKASKLIDALLRPQEKLSPLGDVSGPRKLAGPKFLERPEAPLTRYTGLPPRSSVRSAGKPRLPSALAEGAPLSDYRGDPQPPAAVQLPSGQLVKRPGADLTGPAPVPLLASRRPDRAASSDTTMEFSSAATLQTAIPARTTPAPFMRLNLPDPFEHRQAVRLQNPPEEDPMPVTGSK